MKLLFFLQLVILGMVHSDVTWGEDSAESFRYSCNGLPNHDPDTNHNELIISGTPEDEVYLRWPELKVKDQRDLKVVSIIGCRIKRKDDLDISPFRNITKLYLHNLSIETFDWEWVINNARLELINLDDNPIRNFSNDAQINVKHLSLFNTRLESFPGPFKRFMEHVETLNITGGKFGGTSKEAFELYKNLKQFNGQPRDTSAPVTKTGKTNSGNQILPLALFPMLLVVGKISLSKWACLLAATIFFQSGLAVPLSDPDSLVTETDLHFESTGLQSLDDTDFSAFPALTHLYLTNNSLIRLNVNSESLTFLKLDNNHLDQIRRDEFQGVPHLKDLSLAGNHLTEVDIDFDVILPELRRLDASRNKNLRRVIIKSQTLSELMLADNTIDHLELKTPKLSLLIMRNSYYNDGELRDICERHSEYSFSITYNRQEDAVTNFYECVAKKASHEDRHNELSISLILLCISVGIMNVLIIYLVVRVCCRKAAHVDASSTEYLCDGGAKRSRTDEVVESETVQVLSASVWPPSVLGKAIVIV